MKKAIVALGLIAILSTGCVSSIRASAWKVNAGGHARCHAWEEPHFTADLEGNPVKSELGLGFITVGSHAGLDDHPEGKWVSLGADIGPK